MPGFDVADDAAWLDTFGVVSATEEDSGDEYVRELRIPTDMAELHITWDVIDGSVRVRMRRAGNVVVDLYREQVARLGVDRNGKSTALVMEYRAANAVGRARIQVTPHVVIEIRFCAHEPTRSRDPVRVPGCRTAATCGCRPRGNGPQR